MTAVDHVEAALARLTREDLAGLTPARRARLKATLRAWGCLCDEMVQPPAKAGVLADLKRGDRTP